MNYFDSIESGHEYLGLLLETVQANIADVESQIKSATGRTEDGLMLALYKLQTGETHLRKAVKILRDLSRLRDVLCK